MKGGYYKPSQDKKHEATLVRENCIVKTVTVKSRWTESRNCTEESWLPPIMALQHVEYSVQGDYAAVVNSLFGTMGQLMERSFHIQEVLYLFSCLP